MKGLDAFNRLLGSKGCSNEELDIIEKELKALEIIRTKHVDISWFITSKNRSTYNLGVGGIHELKKKEYDLLKEVLL